MSLEQVKQAFDVVIVSNYDPVFNATHVVVDLTFTLRNGESYRVEIVQLHTEASLPNGWQSFTGTNVHKEWTKWLALDPPPYPTFTAEIVAANNATPSVVGVSVNSDDINGA